METLTEKISAATSAIFADFSKRTGITQFDENNSNSALTKKLAEFRSEFAVVSGKLSNQLSFILHSLEKVEQEVQTLRQTIAEGEKDLSQCKEESSKLDGKCATMNSKADIVRSEYQDIKSRLDAIDTDAAREKLTEILNKRNTVSKGLAMAEMDIEKMLRERDVILKQCAVEQVYLPLLKGSLSDSSFQVLIIQ
jgi:chromosome segregation ATPase